MKKNKNTEYRDWKRTAEKVQKILLSDEEAVLWWLENADKVYEQNIEYPVSEILPLCENTRKKVTQLSYDNNNMINAVRRYNYSKEDLQEKIEAASIENRLYQDLYWWNIDNKRESVLKIKLKKYMMNIIKAKFIEGKKLTRYAREKGYADNYPHRVMTEIRCLIRDYLKNRGTNDN